MISQYPSHIPPVASKSLRCLGSLKLATVQTSVPECRKNLSVQLHSADVPWVSLEGRLRIQKLLGLSGSEVPMSSL